MIGRHTAALTYSRWERLVFWLRGRWPQGVVDRRLLASDLDHQEALGASWPDDWSSDDEAGPKGNPDVR